MRLLLFLMSCCLPVALAAEELLPYQATYTAKYNGLDITATHQRERLESGDYRETLVAKNFLGRINEVALFRIDDSNMVIPLDYRYERSLLGIVREEQQTFDWKSNTVTLKRKDETRVIPVEKGYQDVVSHKIQIRRDLQAGKTSMSYAVISRGKLKDYSYQVIGKEKIKTPIGTLDTIRIERVREDDDPETIFWLAPNWDYLLVKLQQVEDGDSHSLELQSATIDNHPVLASNS